MSWGANDRVAILLRLLDDSLGTLKALLKHAPPKRRVNGRR